MIDLASAILVVTGPFLAVVAVVGIGALLNPGR